METLTGAVDVRALLTVSPTDATVNSARYGQAPVLNRRKTGPLPGGKNSGSTLKQSRNRPPRLELKYP